MHGFLHFPLARPCVLSAALICVLLSCLLRVLQPEAGDPSLFATATGQARQGTHTDPEVGAPSQSVSAPGQAQQRSLRPVPHPSLLRQLDRPGKGLTHTDEPSANTLGKVQQRFRQLTTIPVQTHLGRRSQCKHTWHATTCDVLRQR
jgi:hypothetical protein